MIFQELLCFELFNIIFTITRDNVSFNNIVIEYLHASLLLRLCGIGDFF